MSEIEQRAREIYAAQFPGDCGYDTRKWIMEGTWGEDEVIAAIVAALTPPEGFVLVPVEPTEAMIEGFWGKIQHGDHERAVAEDAWRDALAARPQVKL